MIYVRSQMHPSPKSGPICKIDGNLLFACHYYRKPYSKQTGIPENPSKIMKYHDFSTKSDTDHRLINIFG